MITLSEVVAININTQTRHACVSNVDVYDIETSLMVDECQPYRIAERVMFWVCEDGLFGEMECIGPPITAFPLCKFSRNMQKMTGIPRLVVDSFDLIGSVENLKDGFRIWFRENGIIDLEVHYGDVRFFFIGQELVSIEANNTMVSEN